MASDAIPAQLPVTNFVPASPAPTAAKVQVSGGTSLPAGGNVAPTAGYAVAAVNATKIDVATSAAAVAGSRTSNGKTVSAQTQAPSASSAKSADVQVLVAQLNKYLNTTGRPNLYRVDPQSSSNIQEVNPANGEVVAQFAASEFPALARSVGASGLLLDSLA